MDISLCRILEEADFLTGNELYAASCERNSNCRTDSPLQHILKCCPYYSRYPPLHKQNWPQYENNKLAKVTLQSPSSSNGKNSLLLAENKHWIWLCCSSFPMITGIKEPSNIWPQAELEIYFSWRHSDAAVSGNLSKLHSVQSESELQCQRIWGSSSLPILDFLEVNKPWEEYLLPYCWVVCVLNMACNYT